MHWAMEESAERQRLQKLYPGEDVESLVQESVYGKSVLANAKAPRSTIDFDPIINFEDQIQRYPQTSKLKLKTIKFSGRNNEDDDEAIRQIINGKPNLQSSDYDDNQLTVEKINEAVLVMRHIQEVRDAEIIAVSLRKKRGTTLVHVVILRNYFQVMDKKSKWYSPTHYAVLPTVARTRARMKTVCSRCHADIKDSTFVAGWREGEKSLLLHLDCCVEIWF